MKFNNDIVREGRYTVRTALNEQISVHNELHVALEVAEQESLLRDGETVYIDPPAYRVTTSLTGSTNPEPIPVSSSSSATVPPEPTPPPTDGKWLVRSPNSNAVYVSKNASTSEIQSSLDSGKDVLFSKDATHNISQPLVINTDGQVVGVYGTGNRPTFIATDCTGIRVNASNVQIYGIYISGVRDGNDDERGIDIRGVRSNVLIENCMIENFKDTIAAVSDKTSSPSDTLMIHGCILKNAFSAFTHATNFFTNRWDNWTIKNTALCYVNMKRPDDQSHNIYADVDSGETITHGTLDNVYTAYGSSHGFQMRGKGVVSNIISEHNAIVGSIFNTSSAKNVIGMFAKDLPDNDPLGIGLEVPNSTSISNIVMAHRLASGRKVAVQMHSSTVPENVSILGPWTTNSYGPVRAGNSEYAGSGVFYSESAGDFVDSTVKVSDEQRDAWLNRSANIFPDFSQAINELYSAYQRK